MNVRPTQQPVLVAVGGNALARRGEPLDWATQLANARRAAAALAPVAATQRVVLTHGNGPQVGMLALGAEAVAATAGGARGLDGVVPLDVLDAETEGMIGYLLTQELANALPGREVAALVTRVVVDPDDPAFEHPTKPVGPVYDETTATDLALHRGWTIARDGQRWRRVVPSPEPRSIVELHSIRTLIDAGVLVVCGGGGGVPVAPDGHGGLRGVEAVVDKDAASAVLAVALGAERLVLLTDVDAAYDGWGTSGHRPIGRTSVAAMRARHFASGSMGPKVAAACRFVERTGRTAHIGALDHAEAVVAGRAGTIVEP
ncbi:MAG: carbamate kinase [Acidimicrobiales bacterium]